MHSLSQIQYDTKTEELLEYSFHFTKEETLFSIPKSVSIYVELRNVDAIQISLCK